MAGKRHAPEQAINRPGEAEVTIAAGGAVAEAARRPGVTGAALLPLAQRLRGSRDRPGQAPAASGVGERPPEASGGGPGAGQPDPGEGV